MANAFYELYRQKAVSPTPGLFVTAAVSNGGLVQLTTSLPHHLQTGDQVAVANVGGVTGATGVFLVTDLNSPANTSTTFNSTNFTLQGSTFGGTYTSGGDVMLPDATRKHNGHFVRWGNGASTAYGDDIKVVALNVTSTGGADPATVYTVNLHTDEYLSAVASAARLLTSSNLSSKLDSTGSGGTFVGGIAQAANVVFSLAGPAGVTVEAIALYKDTGLDITSPLIAYIDTATGLPLTLNGGDVTLVWDTGANKIYSI